MKYRVIKKSPLNLEVGQELEPSTDLSRDLIKMLPEFFEPISERIVLNLTLDLKHVWKEGHKPFTKEEVKRMEQLLNAKEQREGWTVESLRKAWEKNTHNYFKEENIAISKFLAHLSQAKPSGETDQPETFSKRDMIDFTNHVLKAINAAGRGLVCHLNVDKWKEGKQ